MMIRLACVLLALGVAAPAVADIILISSSREILARADDPAGSFTQERQSSLDAGVFSGSVSASAGSHSGFASLDSLISPGVISATAETEGLGPHGFPLGQGFGEATMSVQFEVIEPTPYRFDGQFSAAGSDAGGGLSFSGPGGAVFDLLIMPGAPRIEPFATGGMLDPGVYELNVNIAASVFAPPGADGSFSFVLEVPAPGALALLGAAVMAPLVRRR